MRTSTQAARHAVAMACLATTLSLVSGACNDGSEPPAAAKCIGQVRLQGVKYDSVEAVAKSLAQKVAGAAEVARCGDVGEDPVGPYYPEGADVVQVWSLPEYPTSKVIGVRDGALLQIFVAESVPTNERQRIIADLLRLEAGTG